jgi:pimeloyl-ACP methyl ester carboxylesterase
VTLSCLTLVGETDPEIRYARSGDIYIAYTVTGLGGGCTGWSRSSECSGSTSEDGAVRPRPSRHPGGADGRPSRVLDAAIAFKRMMFGIDVREVSLSIHVPTLVLHRVGDRTCHVGNGRFLAEQIDGATPRELSGDDHIPWMNPAGAEEILA